MQDGFASSRILGKYVMHAGNEESDKTSTVLKTVQYTVHILKYNSSTHGLQKRMHASLSIQLTIFCQS